MLEINTQEDSLQNYLELALNAKNEHTKRLFAQLFVRRWAIAHGVDLQAKGDCLGVVIWCTRGDLLNRLWHH